MSAGSSPVRTMRCRLAPASASVVATEADHEPTRKRTRIESPLVDAGAAFTALPALGSASLSQKNVSKRARASKVQNIASTTSPEHAERASSSEKVATSPDIVLSCRIGATAAATLLPPRTEATSVPAAAAAASSCMSSSTGTSTPTSTPAEDSQESPACQLITQLKAAAGEGAQAGEEW